MILDDDLTVNSTVIRHAEAKVRLQSEIFSYLCYKTGLDNLVTGRTILFNRKSSTGKTSSFPMFVNFKRSSFSSPSSIRRKGEKTRNKILNKEYSKIFIEQLIDYTSEKDIPLSDVYVSYK